MLPAKRMSKLGLSVHRMEPPLSWYSPLRIFERSYWIPGSYVTSNAMSAGSNALPRLRTLCTNSKNPR